MAMTKKHFVELANELAYVKHAFGLHDKADQRRSVWSMSCAVVADACSRANPALNRDRFIEACNAPWKPLNK